MTLLRVGKSLVRLKHQKLLIGPLKLQQCGLSKQKYPNFLPKND